MKYVLVLQDESTKYTVLCPFTAVDTTILLYELRNIFGLIGYPKLLLQHPPEFFAPETASLIDLIKSQEPACVVQIGSCDDLVRTVENEFTILGLEDRFSNLPNWLSLVPDTMEELNKHSYRQVFGMEFS